MKTEEINIFKEKAEKLGFCLVAFTSATVPEKRFQSYKKWLKEGHHADLIYMENSKARYDLNEILDGAKSIIVLATNYKTKRNKLLKDNLKVARYAYGRDYHKFIKKRLVILEDLLKAIIPDIQTRSFVDAVPLLERTMAEKAGIGFVGKNSCLITKEYGSFVFLSEIITNKEIHSCKDHRKKMLSNFSICGSCTLCMDSCPTKAIIAPGKIDAKRCIAYQTIENKGDIPEEIKEKIIETKCLFGCDICQEVCPHNAFSKESQDIEMQKAIAGDQVSISFLKNIKDEEEFKEIFQGSALMRAKLKGLKRIIELFD